MSKSSLDCNFFVFVCVAVPIFSFIGTQYSDPHPHPLESAPNPLLSSSPLRIDSYSTVSHIHIRTLYNSQTPSFLQVIIIRIKMYSSSLSRKYFLHRIIYLSAPSSSVSVKFIIYMIRLPFSASKIQKVYDRRISWPVFSLRWLHPVIFVAGLRAYLTSCRTADPLCLECLITTLSDGYHVIQVKGALFVVYPAFRFP